MDDVLGTGRCRVCPWTRAAHLNDAGEVRLTCHHDGNGRWEAPKMCHDCRSWCHTSAFVNRESAAAVSYPETETQTEATK